MDGCSGSWLTAGRMSVKRNRFSMPQPRARKASLNTGRAMNRQRGGKSPHLLHTFCIALARRQQAKHWPARAEGRDHRYDSMNRLVPVVRITSGDDMAGTVSRAHAKLSA